MIGVRIVFTFVALLAVGSFSTLTLAALTREELAAILLLLSDDPDEEVEVLQGRLSGTGEYLSLFRADRWHSRPRVADLYGVTGSSSDTSIAKTYIGYLHSDQQSLVAGTLYPNGDLRLEIYRDVERESIIPAGGNNNYQTTTGNFQPLDTLPEGTRPSTYRALGAFYTGAATPRLSFPTSVVVDMDTMGLEGINDLAEVLEKVVTSFNVMDAQFLRDTGYDHPIDTVLLVNREQAADWTQTDALVDAQFPGNPTNLFAAIGPNKGSGVAVLCGGHSQNGLGGGANGEFWLVLRHELGHNHGLGHDGEYGVGENFQAAQPRPLGNTLMTGNGDSANVLNARQVNEMSRCNALREQRTDSRSLVSAPWSTSREPLPYPMPPSALMDEVFISANSGPARIDVLANDFDLNRERIAIADFPAITSLGGRVRLIPGDGRQNRDTLEYQYPARSWVDGSYDEFEYAVIDQNGQVSTSKVVIHLNRDTFRSRLPQREMDALADDPAAFADFLRAYNEVSLILDYGNNRPLLALPLPQPGTTFGRVRLDLRERGGTIIRYGDSTLPLPANSVVLLDLNGDPTLTPVTLPSTLDLTIANFPQSALPDLVGTAEDVRTIFSAYSAIRFETIDGFWIGRIELPTAVAEGSVFEAVVASTFSVEVLASGQQYALSRGDNVRLVYRNGQWIEG